MNNLGCSSNCNCGKSIKENLKNIKNAGFSNVMVASNFEDLEKFLIEAKDVGLNVSFVHLFYRYANDLWVKGNSNENYINDICEELRICGKHNVPIAIMHGTSGGAGELALPPSEHGLNCMKIILQAAEKYNVKIALENLDAPNFRSFEYLLDNINSPYLGFCYDVGYHYLYKPDYDIMKKYGNRIIAVHLHDNLMEWEYGYDYTGDMHLLPFDGKINFEKVCKDIAKSPYNGVIMLELHKAFYGLPLGKTSFYDEYSIVEFLKEAVNRAQKIEALIKKYKNL